MTHDDLTDFFAGLAMLGKIAHEGLEHGKNLDFSDQQGAKRAYKIADAMMEERKRRDFEERTSC
jgi:hypothetical protein